MWTVDALILAFNVHFLYFYMFTSYGDIFALLTPIWYVAPWQNTRSQVLSTLLVRSVKLSNLLNVILIPTVQTVSTFLFHSAVNSKIPSILDVLH
jgi:hypothetical protein